MDLRSLSAQVWNLLPIPWGVSCLQMNTKLSHFLQTTSQNRIGNGSLRVILYWSMINKTQWKCRLIWIMWFFLVEIVGSPLKTGFDLLKNMFKGFSFPTGGGCLQCLWFESLRLPRGLQRTPKVPRANEPRFATFANTFDAQRAITDLNGYQMGGTLGTWIDFCWWKHCKVGYRRWLHVFGE